VGLYSMNLHECEPTWRKIYSNLSLCHHDLLEHGERLKKKTHETEKSTKQTLNGRKLPRQRRKSVIFCNKMEKKSNIFILSKGNFQVI